jgi:hypothetical protein
MVAISFFLLAGSAVAAERPRATLNREELRSFLTQLPKKYQSEPWYGKVVDSGEPDPNKCGYGVAGNDGQIKPEGLTAYRGDINNDGRDDVILATRCGGSAVTDSIIEVFTGTNGKPIADDFWQALSKAGKDGSNLPLRFGDPFLSKVKEKTVIHFSAPSENWLWEKGAIGPAAPSTTAK